MFPASLTLSLSSTQTCQYILHRCISSVGVSVCALLFVRFCVWVFKNGSLFCSQAVIWRKNTRIWDPSLQSNRHPHLTHFCLIMFTLVREPKLKRCFKIKSMEHKSHNDEAAGTYFTFSASQVTSAPPSTVGYRGVLLKMLEHGKVFLFCTQEANPASAQRKYGSWKYTRRAYLTSEAGHTASICKLLSWKPHSDKSQKALQTIGWSSECNQSTSAE